MPYPQRPPLNEMACRFAMDPPRLAIWRGETQGSAGRAPASQGTPSPQWLVALMRAREQLMRMATCGPPARGQDCRRMRFSSTGEVAHASASPPSRRRPPTSCTPSRSDQRSHVRPTSTGALSRCATFRRRARLSSVAAFGKVLRDIFHPSPSHPPPTPAAVSQELGDDRTHSTRFLRPWYHPASAESQRRSCARRGRAGGEGHRGEFWDRSRPAAETKRQRLLDGLSTAPQRWGGILFLYQSSHSDFGPCSFRLTALFIKTTFVCGKMHALR